MHDSSTWTRSGAWQTVLARWLLIVALIGGLGLASDGPARTASAQVSPIFTPPPPAQPNENVRDQSQRRQEIPRESSESVAPGQDAVPGQAGAAARGAADPAPSRRRVPADEDTLSLDPPSASCTPERAEASFGASDRLVMSYYYYWYDQASLEDPALALHPPADPPLDWHDVAWHERQLMDMASAGVDVALAVYWGTGIPWSVQGLDKMIEARERLLAAGLRPPTLGLFFDTNLYATILPERPVLSDLTTDEGMETLADQVSGFFRHVPRCHRARVDGRPLVFFWRSDT